MLSLLTAVSGLPDSHKAPGRHYSLTQTVVVVASGARPVLTAVSLTSAREARCASWPVHPPTDFLRTDSLYGPPDTAVA